MNSRSASNPFVSNTRAIQQEIMRFESVHPSIYSLYDIADTIPNLLLQQQIREHIVNIEDSFVNSQEWTLSRSVMDLKLGVLGTINSGKSALVHRYLTGAYVQEESPEGGRFKKEVVIDSLSYLLLIRDEAGLPELQFTQWVDAVIFVFSLENERSFAAIYSFYAKMAHYHTNLQDIPIILVGTQDAISESNPRLIEDSRARKLASDLRRCAYYETCATYGLNVERVFQDACVKILQSRMAVSPHVGIRSSTPNSMIPMRPYYPPQPPALPIGMKPYDAQSQTSSGSGGGLCLTPTQSGGHHQHRGNSPPVHESSSAVRDRELWESRQDRHDRRFKEPRPLREHRDAREQWDMREPRDLEFDPSMAMMIDEGGRQRSFRQSPANVIPPEPPPRRPVMRSINDSPSAQVMLQLDNQTVVPFSSAPLLSSTPLLSRKHSLSSSDEVVRILWKSNSFSKADEEKNLRAKNGDAGLELGVGRVIPLKQGFLYKKSNKPLSREWKKKYVTLLDDGRLTYHPSLNDYMGNVKGKEISLLRTTVKIPGRGPRGSEIPKTNPQFNGKPGSAFGSATGLIKVGTPPDTSVITNSSQASDVTTSLPANGSSPTGNNSKADLPNLKKRPKRGDGDSFEFMVVSLDNVIWHFDSPSLEERDEWVEAIQQQIMTSLQQNPSDKTKNNASDRAVVLEVRSVAGNSVCADCNAPDPSWASLNLGILVCIECCGIHRNLGTHLSRIRSLDLDDWPPDLINIMTSIGNDLANGIWEVNTKGQSKPRPNSSREEKEKWIQSKYRLKEFLPPLPFNNVPYTQQLIDAVARQLVERTILVLAYCSPEHVSAPYSKTDTRTALHIASALANPILIQLLIWYGANVKLFDHEGHSCLFYARSAGSAECAEILLANGCLDNPTLPRRRKVNTPGAGGEAAPSDTFNKLPSSNI